MTDPMSESGVSGIRDRFWERVVLEEMSRAEWEALCDGCGLCCLHKLEDVDTAQIVYTEIRCALLDKHTCQCSKYDTRTEHVPGCLVLKLDEPSTWRWLPQSCAYRRLAEGRGLANWHYLISGDRASVHEAGQSVRGKTRAEKCVVNDDWEAHVVNWVDC